MKYTVWNGTSYSAPRSIRVKVEQTIANGGEKKFGYITITQNSNTVRQGYSTFYQFGRKDALPGKDAIAEGNYSFDNTTGLHSIGDAIQHPENMLGNGGFFSFDWCQVSYNNLWSMDNTVTDYNDNAVVKTIYDPCPAGFKMPAPNAFTGFTTTGNHTYTSSEFNVKGGWDYGYNFYNKISHPDATVWFPASGYRLGDGSLNDVGSSGYYWSAAPGETGDAMFMNFNQVIVSPQDMYHRSLGLSVRPVADYKTRVTPKTPGSSVEAWQEEELDGGHGRH